MMCRARRGDERGGDERGADARLGMHAIMFVSRERNRKCKHELSQFVCLQMDEQSLPHSSMMRQDNDDTE